MRPFLLSAKNKESPLPNRILSRVPQMDKVPDEMMKKIGDAGEPQLAPPPPPLLIHSYSNQANS